MRILDQEYQGNKTVVYMRLTRFLITMKFIKHAFLLTLCVTVYYSNIFALENKKNDTEKEENSSIYSELKFRSIGPALMSGRISDIVIHPENENLWYITAGSGGVWKTQNSGTTWESIFDDQKSYSIGCISLDPQNPNILWVARTLRSASNSRSNTGGALKPSWIYSKHDDARLVSNLFFSSF